ncbi:hypothetical protein AU510_16395 [Lonsdalea britannica]|nr:hypothetical protein AU510_16395 [Lonsdalea britannica]
MAASRWPLSIREITVPTHIIAGELDASTSPDLMKGFLAIPGTNYDVIADAPHMVSLSFLMRSTAILRGIEGASSRA